MMMKYRDLAHDGDADVDDVAGELRDAVGDRGQRLADLGGDVDAEAGAVAEALQAGDRRAGLVAHAGQCRRQAAQLLHDAAAR